MNKYFKLLNEKFSKIIEEDEKDSAPLATDEPEEEEAVLAPVSLKDYTKESTLVAQDGDWKVWKPKSEEGMIILSQGTKWLTGHRWTSNETAYDDIDSESWTLQNWPRAYILINENKKDRATGLPKKFLFQAGWSGMYAASFARYSFASWLLKEDLKKLIEYFSDLKLPYVSNRLKASANLGKARRLGGVYTYPTDGEINWHERGEVNSVIIAPGTRRLNGDAFANFSNITEVVIPDSVTSLGSRVFYRCESLEKVTLSKNLRKIPDYTFYGCNLKSFIVPDNIKEINNGAFGDNYYLKTLYIPSSVVKMDMGIADSWQSIPTDLTIYCQVSEKPEGWDDQWNVLKREYSWRTNERNDQFAKVVWGASKPAVTEDINGEEEVDLNPIKSINFILTQGMVESDIQVEEKEFITKVTLDKDVQSIPTGMFAGCKNLKEIVFNDKIEFIGTRAFADCFSLQEVTIPSSVDFISSGAFHSCILLETVKSYSDFPDAPNFQPLGIFNGCYGITLHVKNQEIKERWETYLSRNGNDDSIMEIVIMDEQEKKTKFSEDVEQEEDAEEDTVSFKIIPDREILLNTPEWQVVRPVTLEAFLEISKGVDFNKGEHFSNYFKKEPEKFYENPSMIKYLITDKKSDEVYLYVPKHMSDYIISKDEATYLLPFLEEINSRDLQNWFKRKFTSLNRPIQRFQDARDKAEEVNYTYTYSNELSADENKDRWDYKTVELITKIIIKEGTKTIEDEAFRGFRSVKEIVIPKSVVKIGKQAFAECRALESIIIPEGVPEIGYKTFWGCDSLKEVKLPSTIKTIAWEAFWSCESLTSINIPQGLVKISAAAFLGCHALSSVYIPSSVVEIGEQAFEIRNSYYSPEQFGKATIYCEAPSKPDGWNKKWTTPEVEVIWGAKPNLKEEVTKVSKFYHLSEEDLDGQVFSPQIPKNFMTEQGYEDTTIKRVRFAETIDGALLGLSQNLKGKVLFVHEPETYDLKVMTNEEIVENNYVPDAELSKELWVLEDVKLKKVGKIKVLEAKEEPVNFTYGDNIKGETYYWNYEVIEGSEIKETMVGYMVF
jgi:hypothetical protein